MVFPPPRSLGAMRIGDEMGMWDGHLPKATAAPATVSGERAFNATGETREGNVAQ